MRVRYSECPANHSELFFSVVIANYNYGRFLRQAVESALTQDWPHVEVIVVDDGSTDNSAEVIGSFGEAITAIFKENGGQREANNVGFAKSSGDVVSSSMRTTFWCPARCARSLRCGARASPKCRY